MQTCDPLEARRQFRQMVRMNWVIAIVVFIPLVFILQMMLPFVFADVIALGAVFVLFFFILKKRTLVLKCPRCENLIETNTPWECGVCGSANFRVYDYPFVAHCENEKCACEPKAYKCHHQQCGALIYLSPEKSDLNYARCFTKHERTATEQPRERKPKKEDAFASAVIKREQNIKLKGLDVQETLLDVELKGLKAKLQPIKRKTLKDRLRSGVFSRSELDDEVRRLKAEADKEFAHDERARQKRYADIDAEARELL